MKKYGASQERLNNLDEGSIVEYLQRHPDFFVRHAQQVEALQVVHPVRGAVSLVEWHLARQRNHIHLLEESIGNLMSQANVNEALFCRLLQLQGRLATASSLQDMLNRFQRWAREMGLSGVNIRLFSDRWRIGAPSDFTHLALSRHTFEPLRIQRFGDAHHYLGPLNGPELLLLLPQAKAVGSVAMSLLGDSGERGVVIFTSRDAQHYVAGQGTRFLEELARMLPALLEHWLEPQ